VFAHPDVASAVLRGPELIAQVMFTPLLAAFSIWVGIAVSTRSSDIRVAQQLSMLGTLPLVILAALIAFGVIHATTTLALVLGVLLIIIDMRGWRIVGPMLDRERLITGSKQ
jgi:ABC-2 type transport system permease protein